MSESAEKLRHQIASAGELGSVVRTMKAMAASSVNQYEEAVRALEAYHQTLQLALGACLRQQRWASPAPAESAPAAGALCAVVFGSDQGLVGAFNDVVVDAALSDLRQYPGRKRLWPVGERAQVRLADAGVEPVRVFALPAALAGITGFVAELLVALEAQRDKGEMAELRLFYHQPRPVEISAPVCERLLPLDAQWRRRLEAQPWPTRQYPQMVGGPVQALADFLREYLFVSLYRACAESLASENANRLAAMQRAEKNIGDLLEQLTRTFHRTRQNRIDDELFDLVSGFEALSRARP